MFKKQIIRLKKTFNADQLESQIFIIQKRYIAVIISIMVPMEIDKLFQSFFILSGLIGKGDNLQGIVSLTILTCFYCFHALSTF